MGAKISTVQPWAKTELMVWFAGGDTRTLAAETLAKHDRRFAGLTDEAFRAVTALPEGEGLSWDGGLAVSADEVRELAVPLDLVARETVRLIADVSRLRRTRGLSQAKVADAVGIKQPVVARLETGANSPRLDTLLKVLSPLGKTLALVDLDEVE